MTTQTYATIMAGRDKLTWSRCRAEDCPQDHSGILDAPFCERHWTALPSGLRLAVFVTHSEETSEAIRAARAVVKEASSWLAQHVPATPA